MERLETAAVHSAPPKSELEQLIERAKAGDPAAQCKLGVAYDFGKGVTADKKAAYKWYRRAADQGYAKAQYCLGWVYRDGLLDIQKDEQTACFWFQKAADQGNNDAREELEKLQTKLQEEQTADTQSSHTSSELPPYIQNFLEQATQGDAEAQFNLGVAYERGEGVQKDVKTAFEWYQRSAEQGDVDAQFNLGVMYSKGRGTDKDEKIAGVWYRKAAEQGHASAQYNLGVMHENGRGVQKSVKTACDWYRLAAEQGIAEAQQALERLETSAAHSAAPKSTFDLLVERAEAGDVAAQYDLGVAYDIGKGVLKDKQTACAWYRFAAEQGHAKAQYSLGWMYEIGEGILEDKKAACEWYQRAAEQGNAQAQKALGESYEFGVGVTKNEKMATGWYLKAAKQKMSSAQYRYGMACKEGFGVSKDHTAAFGWIKLAANQKHSNAEYVLAEMLEKGEGTEVDLKSAGEWYQKAADHGIEDAQKALERIKEKLKLEQTSVGNKATVTLAAPRQRVPTKKQIVAKKPIVYEPELTEEAKKNLELISSAIGEYLDLFPDRNPGIKPKVTVGLAGQLIFEFPTATQFGWTSKEEVANGLLEGLKSHGESFTYLPSNLAGKLIFSGSNILKLTSIFNFEEENLISLYASLNLDPNFLKQEIKGEQEAKRREEEERRRVEYLNSEIAELRKDASYIQNKLAAFDKLETNLKETVRESFRASQAQEAELETIRNSLASTKQDDPLFDTLKAREKELISVLDREKEHQLALREKIKISNHDSLFSFYMVFRCLFNDVMNACKVIHSGMLEDLKITSTGKSTKIIDSISKVVKKVAGKVPIINIFSEVFTALLDQASDVIKETAAQTAATYLPDMAEIAKIAELLARYLTLAEEHHILKKSNVPATGIMGKIKGVINKITVNDIDTEVKQYAEALFKIFLGKVFTNAVKKYPEASDIPYLVSAITNRPFNVKIYALISNVDSQQSLLVAHGTIDDDMGMEQVLPHRPSRTPLADGKALKEQFGREAKLHQEELKRQHDEVQHEVQQLKEAQRKLEAKHRAEEESRRLAEQKRREEDADRRQKDDENLARKLSEIQRQFEERSEKVIEEALRKRQDLDQENEPPKRVRLNSALVQKFDPVKDQLSATLKNRVRPPSKSVKA